MKTRDKPVLQNIPMPEHVAKRLIPAHLMSAAVEAGIAPRAKEESKKDCDRVYIDCDFSSLELRIWAEFNRNNK